MLLDTYNFHCYVLFSSCLLLDLITMHKRLFNESEFHQTTQKCYNSIKKKFSYFINVRKREIKLELKLSTNKIHFLLHNAFRFLVHTVNVNIHFANQRKYDLFIINKIYLCVCKEEILSSRTNSRPSFPYETIKM